MVFVVFMMAFVSVLDLGFGKLVFWVFGGQPKPADPRQRMEHTCRSPTSSTASPTSDEIAADIETADGAVDDAAERATTRPRSDGADAADDAEADEDAEPSSADGRRAEAEAEADETADAEADADARTPSTRPTRTPTTRPPRPTRPTEAEPAEDDPLEEFRRELWAKPGDWFVVHTYSGMENRVKPNLENRIISLNMEDYIHEIVVPTEEVAEIKNGQRKMVKRTVLPGYVLVRMDLTDESWAAVRHTPSVTGFVGHSHQPVPLSMAEVENMLAPAVVAAAEAAAAAAGGAAWRRHGQEAGRGRRLRRVRLGHGRRRPVRHAARDDHRDQRRGPAGQGPRRDLRPGDPGRAELQPDPEGLSAERQLAGHATPVRHA